MPVQSHRLNPQRQLINPGLILGIQVLPTPLLLLLLSLLAWLLPRLGLRGVCPLGSGLRPFPALALDLALTFVVIITLFAFVVVVLFIVATCSRDSFVFDLSGVSSCY